MKLSLQVYLYISFIIMNKLLNDKFYKPFIIKKQIYETLFNRNWKF